MSAPLATGRAGLQVTGSLTRSMVDGVRAIRPDRARAAKALRIAICVVAPLLVGLAAGHPGWGLAATFGAFAGFHGHVEPYPQRARLLAVLVVAYLVAVLVGTLATTGTVALILLTGLFAAIAGFLCQALTLPAPREYMLILICLLTDALPGPLASTAGVVGLTLAGGAWAWLVGMSGWLTDRERPEREAVRAGLSATLALLEQQGPSDLSLQHAAVLATRTARRSVELAGGPTATELRRIQLASEDLLDQVLGLPPSLTVEEAEVAADISVEGRPDPRVEMRLRARQLLMHTNAALPERGFRRGTRNADASPPLRTGLWSVRNALGRSSLVLPMAGRVGVAVSAGLALGQLSGAPRPYWIALTTAAVLQGATLMTTARRSMERAIGTGVGVLLGGLVVALEPSSWWIVAGVAAFLFLAEMTIAASYVVAVAFITPMTLLLAEVGAPGQISQNLIAWRLGDTVIGCLVGLAAGRLLWPGAARERLDDALGSTLRAIATVLHPANRPVYVGDGVTASAAEELRAARHELRVQLLNLRAITDAGLGDRLTAAPREDQLWPVSAATQQLGYRSLAARGEPDRALDDELARLTAQMDQRVAELGGPSREFV